MTAPGILSTVLLWHRRILGGFWALCGLVCLADLRRDYWWEHGWPALLPFLIGTLFVFGGVRFLLGQRWSGRMMIGMMLIAGLFSLDMVLFGGWASNHLLLRLALVGLGLSVYTALVVIASAIRSSRATA